MQVSTICSIFAPRNKKSNKIMETTNTTTATIPKTRRLSKTWRTAVANKWMIELVDPELQAQCKSYKDGKKIINP